MAAHIFVAPPVEGLVLQRLSEKWITNSALTSSSSVSLISEVLDAAEYDKMKSF